MNEQLWKEKKYTLDIADFCAQKNQLKTLCWRVCTIPFNLINSTVWKLIWDPLHIYPFSYYPYLLSLNILGSQLTFNLCFLLRWPSVCLKFLFLNAETKWCAGINLYISLACPSVCLVCKEAKADLAFLVDGSWSIGDDNFMKITRFLYSTMGSLDLIGPDGTQVSHVTTHTHRSF